MDIHWIEKQWKEAHLGDKRRNKRAIKIANSLLANPSASFPKQLAEWASLKAAYRLFNEEEVTFDALQQPHRDFVIKQAQASKLVLFIQDGSELDYSSHDIDLGPIGNHQGRGFCLHTTIAIDLEKGKQKFLGICSQLLWERRKEKIKETRTQIRARHNEADVWSDSLKNIGANRIGKRKWVTIGDRGADIFEFLKQCQDYGYEAVIRVKHNRRILPEEKSGKVLKLLKAQSSQGTFKLERRGRDSKPKMTHTLQISWCQAQVRPPKYLKNGPLNGTYIRVWEEEKNGLEWVLFSSLPIKSFEEAYEKVKWYSMRWIIEEYHKCLKTGCAVERRYFQSGKALKAMIGMFGILAAKLLWLKYFIREKGEELAEEVVTNDLINIIKRRYNLQRRPTIKNFWRHVAKLGGFLGRKNDGEPGWQTIWLGWIKLLTMRMGIEDFQKCG